MRVKKSEDREGRKDIASLGAVLQLQVCKAVEEEGLDDGADSYQMVASN